MDGTQSHVVTHETISEHRATGVFGGSVLEGFGAIATIALAIVGLAGIFAPTMAAIATIVVGAAILVEAGAFGAAKIERPSWTFFRGTMGVDVQGGLATIVLGILALLGIASQTLLAVAVIVLGASFLLSNRFLIGLGGVVLGILAVVGIDPATLVLVGLLVFGAGLVFSGSANAVRTVAAAES